MRRHEREVAVYTFSDSTGEVVYVGCTQNLHRRLQLHRSTSPWYSEVASVRKTIFTTRPLGLKRESELIRSLQPKYNTNGKSSPPARGTDTPRAELVNLKLQAKTGEALGAAVERLRADGQIWSDIAAYLTVQTGVEIGREGLRQWFKDEVAA